MYRPMPIDRTLKALEDIADTKGLKLEDVDGYESLCAFLTALEDDEFTEWVSRVEAFEVLKRIIAYVAPGWVGREMEFHQKCQPAKAEEVAQ